MDANRGTAKANVHDVNARHRRMAKRETSSGLDDHNRVAPFWVLFAPAASAANAWNPPKLPAPPAVVVDLVRTPFVERRRGLLSGPTPHFKGALMKASSSFSSSSRTRAQVERVLLSRCRRRRSSPKCWQKPHVVGVNPLCPRSPPNATQTAADACCLPREATNRQWWWWFLCVVVVANMIMRYYLRYDVRVILHSALF